jgi:hypothetical protein
LKRGDIFQAHRHRSLNRVTHHHVDFGLTSEKSEHLTNVIALKFTNTNSTAFNIRIRFSQCRTLERGR